MTAVVVEEEDGTVLKENPDLLPSVAALVEQFTGWLRIVVGNPFADGLPRWLGGFEGLESRGFCSRRLRGAGWSAGPGVGVVECGPEEIGGFEDFEVSLEKRTRSVRLMKIAIPESGRANAAKGFDIRRLPCR
jgi:hypothetical protein